MEEVSLKVCVVCVCVELKETAERGQAQYRTEKQKLKGMALRVNNMEEELQDLKTDKDSMERVSMAHSKCSCWFIF
jgi:hypothetical protein